MSEKSYGWIIGHRYLPFPNNYKEVIDELLDNEEVDYEERKEQDMPNVS